MRHIVVFGSVARGEDRADSDVDLAVEIEDGRSFSLIRMEATRLLLEDVPSRPVDLGEIDSLRPKVRAAWQRSRTFEGIRVAWISWRLPRDRRTGERSCSRSRSKWPLPSIVGPLVRPTPSPGPRKWWPCRKYQYLVVNDMSKNTSFSVGEHFTGFIEARVSEGRYSSASDVVRAGLRLLEEQETRLAALRDAIAAGDESGVSDRNVLDIWAAVKERGGIARG